MNDLSSQTCLDFWREMQEQCENKHAKMGFKIKTWTTKDEIDIVTLALDAQGNKTSDSILMVDKNGGRILSEELKRLFYDGASIFIKFNSTLQSIRIIISLPLRAI